MLKSSASEDYSLLIAALLYKLKITIFNKFIKELLNNVQTV